LPTIIDRLNIFFLSCNGQKYVNGIRTSKLSGKEKIIMMFEWTKTCSRLAVVITSKSLGTLLNTAYILIRIQLAKTIFYELNKKSNALTRKNLSSQKNSTLLAKKNPWTLALSAREFFL
jgi:hypothetical protein